MSKSVFYYSSVKDDSAVIDKLNQQVEVKSRRGFPYLFNRIRNDVLRWNKKRRKTGLQPT